MGFQRGLQQGLAPATFGEADDGVERWPQEAIVASAATLGAGNQGVHGGDERVAVVQMARPPARKDHGLASATAKDASKVLEPLLQLEPLQLPAEYNYVIN